MAIDATLLDSIQKHSPSTRSTGTARVSSPDAVSRFEAILSHLEKTEGTGKAAAATAEIIQLEMMHNALTMDPSSSLQSLTSSSLPIELILAESLNGATSAATTTDEEPAITATESLPTLTTKAPTPNLDSIISSASQKYGVDPALIKAVIRAESNFNPTAVSHAGAQGLMQLMPSTARGLGVTNSFDPVQNVMGGTRFLKDMLERYGGNVDKALAAYNWGPGNVDKGSRALPKETRDYLVKVKQLYYEYAA